MAPPPGRPAPGQAEPAHPQDAGGEGALVGAYRAGRTLEQTYQAIPKDVVDEVLLIDDASTDATPEIAVRLGLKTFVHDRNLGYGANQKTCYREALRAGADIVVMLHPDYQYE